MEIENDTVLQIVKDLSEVKVSQRDIKETLDKMDERITVLEDNSKSWKITKRIFIALATIVIGLVTLNWTVVAANWKILFGPVGN